MKRNSIPYWEKFLRTHWVAIVSVVGAFRTGKSFLLSWFLRYLHHLTNQQSTNPEKKTHDETPWYEQFETLDKNHGFEWQGGADGITSGIWMWSEPFVIPKSCPKLAVLLVDTQGMFDNETVADLGTKVFGLSTLLSSFQVYNVSRQVQEDNLQHLAWFSEYARVARKKSCGKCANQSEGCGNQSEECANESKKPFQVIQFLVRDWQNFTDVSDRRTVKTETQEYLKKLMSKEKKETQLQETRQKIDDCFETISCFLLCNPGLEVCNIKYKGEVCNVQKDFLKLLDWYCQQIFDPNKLSPNKINGRKVSAAELCVFMKGYASAFAVNGLPTATNLLTANAKANYSNALTSALQIYKAKMDQLAGTYCSDYVKPHHFEAEHKNAKEASLEKFRSVAVFGDQELVNETLEVLQQNINKLYDEYKQVNEMRRPLTIPKIMGKILPVILVAGSVIAKAYF